MADRRSTRLLTRVIGRRWRDYETESGARPVKEFINGLSDADAAEVAAAMAEVKRDGLRAARHLRGEILSVIPPGTTPHDRTVSPRRRSRPELRGRD